MQASSDVGFAPYLLVFKMYKIRLLKCKDTDGPYGRELSGVLQEDGLPGRFYLFKLRTALCLQNRC